MKKVEKKIIKNFSKKATKKTKSKSVAVKATDQKKILASKAKAVKTSTRISTQNKFKQKFIFVTGQIRS